MWDVLGAQNASLYITDNAGRGGEQTKCELKRENEVCVAE